MKKSRILTLSSMLSAALLCSAPALASDKACSLNNGSISVVGIGQYKATPDEAVLNFQIQADEATAAAARDKAEATVSAFLQALDKLKLPQGAVVADNLTVSARYSYQDGKSTLMGFQGIRSVRVTLDDFSLIGEVTDLAFKSGINEAVGFSYQLKDPQAAQREARALAIADAKQKAQELAQGFEVKLGQPCQLSYGSSPVISPRPMMLMARAASNSADSAAVYTTDDLTIRAEVNAVFAIAHKK